MRARATCAGMVCFALAGGGGDVAAPPAGGADTLGAARGAADSLGAAPGSADTLAVPFADTIRAPAAAVRDTLSPRPAKERAAIAPPDRPPWKQLLAPADTLVLSREEVERTGAHLPLELLALVPGVHALEAAGTVPLGALALAGSFAAADLEADGWPVRLPRLEGRDLSRLMLDRLGPGPTLVPLAGPGELRVIDAAGSAPGAPAFRMAPSEPVADSSRSRIAAYHGGFGLTGGGLLFSDRRGPITYGFGVDNSGAQRSGSVSGVSTRLAVIDAGGATSWGRISASARGSEASIDWKNGRRLKHDDQGAAVEAVAGDTLGPAWSLRLAVLDDRLSGSEFPGLEFRRKEAGLEARWWARPTRPLWLRVAGERDWFGVRFADGAFTPRVARGQLEAGARARAGPSRLHLGLALRASDRHPRRGGGQVELEVGLPLALTLGVGASRAHRPPTLDQEVLAVGLPVAEPEQHDEARVRLTSSGPLPFGILVARRRLAHQAQVIEEARDLPWPEFRFTAGASEHWEVRALLSTPPGPLGFEAGVWGSRLSPIDEPSRLAPFVPEAVARAFVTLRLGFLGGDLVLRPRFDGLAVGERADFAGRRHAGYARFDATLVAVVGERVDLELRVRNVLDRHYPLAVLDPATDQLYRDSGRMTLVGVRWRLAN